MLTGAGFNLAALAFLGAILASGSEEGGLGARWMLWGPPALIAALAGTLVFRFPRAAGLPLAALILAAGFIGARALEGFRPVDAAFRPPTVQPLTDRELVTAFSLRLDWVELPRALPLVPRALCRIRTDPGEPPEWWWSWAASRGWARSSGAPVPDQVLKFGVYRLELADGSPRWRLVQPPLELGGFDTTAGP